MSNICWRLMLERRLNPCLLTSIDQSYHKVGSDSTATRTLANGQAQLSKLHYSLPTLRPPKRRTPRPRRWPDSNVGKIPKGLRPSLSEFSGANARAMRLAIRLRTRQADGLCKRSIGPQHEPIEKLFGSIDIALRKPLITFPDIFIPPETKSLSEIST